MIQVITEYPIHDMLLHPEDYIDEYEDTVLIKVFEEDHNNPIIIMLGYDDKKNSYYFVIEDNDISEDVYCATDKLVDTYDIIIEKALKGEI